MSQVQGSTAQSAFDPADLPMEDKPASSHHSDLSEEEEEETGGQEYNSNLNFTQIPLEQQASLNHSTSTNYLAWLIQTQFATLKAEQEMEMDGLKAQLKFSNMQTESMLGKLAAIKTQNLALQKSVQSLDTRLHQLQTQKTQPPSAINNTTTSNNTNTNKTNKSNETKPATTNTYANKAATNQGETSFTLVTSKKKTTKPAPLFKPDYTTDKREVIIELTETLPTSITPDTILDSINNRLVSMNTSILAVRKTNSDNLIITTRPTDSADKFIAKFKHEITSACKLLRIPITNIRANSMSRLE